MAHGGLSHTGTRQAAGGKGWEQGEGRGEAGADVCPLGARAGPCKGNLPIPKLLDAGGMSS